MNNIFFNIIFKFVLYIYIVKFLPMCLSEIRRKISSIYQISFTVEGIGAHIILENSPMPIEIYINNKQEDVSSSSSYYLPKSENEIIIIWDELPSCAGLFKNFDSVTEIDLSDFDLSKITDMSEMFSGCYNLKSIKFNDECDTSNLLDMRNMFFNCTKLLSMDLSCFDTEKVTNMDGMFQNAESLLSLDLGDFNTYELTSMNRMFLNCKSLIYINLIRFSYIQNIENIFSSNIDNLVYCVDKDSNIYSFLQNNEKLTFDCNNLCFNGGIKILFEEKKCSRQCTGKYKYKIGNICFQSDPDKPKYEYYEENEEITHSSELEISENGESSNSNEMEQSDIENNEKLSDTQKIIEERKNEDEIISRKNEFFEQYFPDSQQKNDIKNKDDIIKNLKEEIISGNINLLLSDIINGTKNDIIAEYKDIVYQITTTENQKDNIYNNLSTINLGSCETKLKTIYGIDEKLSLIVLKIDYKMEGLLIPVIGYEVYHPLNKSKLDLNYCSDTTIKINIPVSIDEDKVYLYDPNSDFYNDDCYAYTTEDGTDIIINDRKNEFIDNNLSLCENNCSFNGYDSDSKKALCECETKIEINLISEIIKEENILSNSFNSSTNSTNLGAMKCVSLLFSKDGLLSNIGSYFLLFTLLFFIVSTIIFYKCGYNMLENNIQEIVSSKSYYSENNSQINIFETKKRLKSQKKRKKIKKITKANPSKKKKTKKIKFRNPNLKEKVHQKSQSELKKTNVNILVNYEQYNNKNVYKKNALKIKNKKKRRCIKEVKKNVIDFEMNSFSYKEAIIFDKRTYFQYYFH